MACSMTPGAILCHVAGLRRASRGFTSRVRADAKETLSPLEILKRENELLRKTIESTGVRGGLGLGAASWQEGPQENALKVQTRQVGAQCTRQGGTGRPSSHLPWQVYYLASSSAARMLPLRAPMATPAPGLQCWKLVGHMKLHKLLSPGT